LHAYSRVNTLRKHMKIQPLKPLFQLSKRSLKTWCASLFFIVTTSKIMATPAPFIKSNALWVGPELYYIERFREGGANQKGLMVGLRTGYDHIKRYRLYWGGDFLYAEGRLTGRNSSKRSLKSTLTDYNYEARFGYTLQCGYWRMPYFTPYIGGGYFQETNKFHHPSPLTIQYRDSFKYATVGFFSGLELNPKLTFGINAKVKMMVDGKSKISDDPEKDDTTILMQDELQYRVEAPLHFYNCWKSQRFQTSFIPFYEFRHFGGRENYPFDFIDTEFHLWGLQIEVAYRF
jgi:hypothetical protein